MMLLIKLLRYVMSPDLRARGGWSGNEEIIIVECFRILHKTPVAASLNLPC